MTYQNPEAAGWSTLLTAARIVDTQERRAFLGQCESRDALSEIYRSVLEGDTESRPYVIAHLAQSLDGRIALPAGESQWISGPDDLAHTHRLRALCDAVIVGARTVASDDPRLTVRHIEGPNPLRVVLDPRDRLRAEHQLMQTDPERTLVIACSPRPDLPRPAHVEVLAMSEGWFSPHQVLDVLARRGVRRVLVEGGGITVSAFLAAGLLDRLHLVTAPLLVGTGRPSLTEPMGATLAACPRPITRVLPLGQDWLFDCVFP